MLTSRYFCCINLIKRQWIVWYVCLTYNVNMTIYMIISMKHTYVYIIIMHKTYMDGYIHGIRLENGYKLKCNQIYKWHLWWASIKAKCLSSQKELTPDGPFSLAEIFWKYILKQNNAKIINARCCTSAWFFNIQCNLIETYNVTSFIKIYVDYVNF